MASVCELKTKEYTQRATLFVLNVTLQMIKEVCSRLTADEILGRGN